ncbi:MAG: ribonuclease HII [Pseudomonadota bacterium]
MKRSLPVRIPSIVRKDDPLPRIDQLLSEGYVLAGVDEVGRGPLAGDVVAAAVILNPLREIGGLADSKTLNATTRSQLALSIRNEARAFALGIASPAEIDSLNILQASLLAMQRAVDELPVKPDVVFVDGRHLPKWRFASCAVIKGDARLAMIGAASIVAKDSRDQTMIEQHQRWPIYGFDAHKGYPTKQHLAALRRQGPCPIHRRSFGPVRDVL